MISRRGSLAFVALSLAAACGTQNGAGFDGGLGSGDDAGNLSDDASSSASADGGTFVAGDGGGTSDCTACSSDLHQVLDCTTHQVLATCPSDEGCAANGQCVSPCASAAANQSSIGCEYYALNPDAFSSVPDNPLQSGSRAGGCFAAFVANTWTTSVTVSVGFGDQALDVSHSLYLPQGSGLGLSYVPVSGGTIPPNQVAILFLAHFHDEGSDAGGNLLLGADGGFNFGPGPSDETPCPAGVTPAYTVADAAVHGTGMGHAFHITTTAPVVAYDIYPYGGASSYVSSATLLLPTSVWNTNYVAVSAYQGEDSSSGEKVDSNVAFVASQDDTTVTINPSAAVVGGNGVAPADAGAPQSYVLNQGESLQLEQLADLTGSAVQADKPIGAWGGHWCMFVPFEPSSDFVSACDGAHQQIPPVKALGSEYVAVRYRDRLGSNGAGETVPWRLMGMVDDTTLTYEPSAPSGAPSTLSRGQVVEFMSSGPFVVESQDDSHPFYAAEHMTGGSLANGLGDPETANVVPSQQWLDDYTFFTDPTYAETNLVVVRAAGGPGVSLDCASGPLAGWQAVGTRYEYTRIDVQRHGAKVGNCDNGRHEMTSKAPFGLTVWGFDQYVSYAYPAGASVKPINHVVVPVVPIPR